MSLLWINPASGVVGTAGPKFTKHVDQRCVDALEYRRMLGHRQIAKLSEPAQGVVHARFTGSLGLLGLGLLGLGLHGLGLHGLGLHGLLVIGLAGLGLASVAG